MWDNNYRETERPKNAFCFIFDSVIYNVFFIYRIEKFMKKLCLSIFLTNKVQDIWLNCTLISVEEVMLM